MRLVSCFTVTVVDPEFFSTILLAGHETSATTLCWVLLEIAKNPDVQKRLREEIRSTERAIHARGDADFTAADLDNMEYLAAVMKVVPSLNEYHIMFVHNVHRNQCATIQLCTKIIAKLQKMIFYHCRPPSERTTAKLSRTCQLLKGQKSFFPLQGTTGNDAVDVIHPKN